MYSMSEKATGKAHHRSPSYPSVDLEDAIELAQKFHDQAKRTVVPSQHVAAYWGFSTSSSGWRLALAALKQYGLVESVGSKKSGEVKLTDLALSIILDTRPNSRERTEAVKQAALAPEIYKELWLHWGGNVPDDDTFRTYLTLNKGFNENSVPGFISDFKKTIAFAKLDTTDIVRTAGAAARSAERQWGAGEDEEGNGGDTDGDQGSGQRRRSVQSGMKEDVFTLPDGQVVLQWPENIDPDELEDVQSWMEMMVRKIKRYAQKRDGEGSTQ